MTVTTLTKRSTSTVRVPEYRLYTLFFATPLLLVGLLLFGLGLENQKEWPIIIIGGIGVYYVGLNILTGVVQTYMVDSYQTRAMGSIALFNFIKCVFAFAVPFFVPEWAFTKGFKNAYVTQGVLVTVLGLALTLSLVIWGKKLRAIQVS